MKYIIPLFVWKEETVFNAMHELEKVYNGIFAKYAGTLSGSDGYLLIDTENRNYSFWNNAVGMNVKEISLQEFCEISKPSIKIRGSFDCPDVGRTMLGSMSLNVNFQPVGTSTIIKKADE